MTVEGVMKDEPHPIHAPVADGPEHNARNAQFAEPWYLAERCKLECGRAEGTPLALLVVEARLAIGAQAADWLPRGLRRGDVVTHFGGGRYAILLPGAGAYDAGRVAARIRQRDSRLDIGIAVHPQDGSNLSDLVGAALRDLPGPFQMSA